nr:transcription factor MYC4-like [Coffea arabica]
MEDDSFSHIRTRYMRLIKFYQSIGQEKPVIPPISGSRPEDTPKGERAIRVIATRPEDELMEMAIRTLFVRPEDRLKHRRSSVARDDNIQKRLKSVIQDARQGWTYAIFWRVSEALDPMNPLLLSWCDGYFSEEAGQITNFRAMPPPCVGELEHRKSVFRQITSLLCEGVAEPEEEVTDSLWFFLVSATQFFVGGAGLPGRAFETSTAIWVTGTQKLAGLDCTHADEARKYGIQTLVNTPVEDGVVELGSTIHVLDSSHV